MPNQTSGFITTPLFMKGVFCCKQLSKARVSHTWHWYFYPVTEVHFDIGSSHFVPFPLRFASVIFGFLCPLWFRLNCDILSGDQRVHRGVAGRVSGPGLAHRRLHPGCVPLEGCLPQGQAAHDAVEGPGGLWDLIAHRAQCARLRPLLQGRPSLHRWVICVWSFWGVVSGLQCSPTINLARWPYYSFACWVEFKV